MPYKTFKIGNKWAVYKIGSDGKKTGEPVGRHTSRSKANKQIAALAINVEEIMDIQPKTLAEQPVEEYHGPSYEMIDKSDVPWGAMSFADVDVASQAEELMERLEERTSQFYTLFWRIWNNMEIPVTEKVSSWKALFAEFTQVFQDEIATDETEVEELDSLTENLTGSIIRVSESDKTNGENRRPLLLDVVVIEPGWGNPADNHYYPKEVLRRDSAAVFEGAKMYATDHRAEEKSVRTEVGKIERIIRFSETGAPIARVKIWNADFSEDIRNRNKVDELSTLECSILAKGRAVKGKIDGRDANIVEAIIPSKHTNVDFVTSAGAGGRALQLVENDKEVDMPDELEPVEVQEPAAADVQEAENVILHENQEVELPEQETETVAEVAINEPIYLTEAEVSSILENSKLPEISRKRMAKIQVLSEAALLSEIEAEKDYIKTLIRSGEPFAMGETSPISKSLNFEEIAKDHQKRIDAVIFGN